MITKLTKFLWFGGRSDQRALVIRIAVINLASDALRWHVCRVNFARKTFFELWIFLRKMPRNFPWNFPRNVWAFLLRVRKNPAKFPPKFPPNFLNFPAKNQKISQTSFCRSAGRMMLRELPRDFSHLRCRNNNRKPFENLAIQGRICS